MSLSKQQENYLSEMEDKFKYLSKLRSISNKIRYLRLNSDLVMHREVIIRDVYNNYVDWAKFIVDHSEPKINYFIRLATYSGVGPLPEWDWFFKPDDDADGSVCFSYNQNCICKEQSDCDVFCDCADCDDCDCECSDDKNCYCKDTKYKGEPCDCPPKYSTGNS